MKNKFIIFLLGIVLVSLMGCNPDNGKVNKYTLTLQIEGEGEVYYNENKMGSTLVVAEGESVTFKAVAKNGSKLYGFFQYGSIQETSDVYTFIMKGFDSTVKVKFEAPKEEDVLQSIMDTIAVPSEITTSLDLMIPENNEVNCEWSSDNETIEIVNNIPYVKEVDSDVIVTLTVKLTLKEKELTKDFNVIVKKVELDYTNIEDLYKDTITKAKIKGTIVATNNKNFLLKDETGYIEVLIGAFHDYQVGQIVNVEGVISTSNTVKQITPSQDINITDQKPYEEEATAIDDSYLIEYLSKEKQDLVGAYVKIEGAYTIDSANHNLTVSGFEGIVNMGNPNINIIESITEGGVIIVEGYLTGINSGNYIQIMPTRAEDKYIENINEEIVIYSLNDLHGVISPTNKSSGMSAISRYIKENKNELTVILSAGDMFQGTAVSSMTRGKAMVEIMNEIGFDAMTIGNHEFDWGIEEILKYNDGNKENIEANFKLLAANIQDKLTGNLASWATPYTVLQKGDYKIGVVGVLGQDQTSDILASYVNNYNFTDELTAIKKYTQILRTTEKCDIVIASCHLDTSDINNKLSALTGDFKIDAIINGHTHQYYYGDLTYGRTVPLPYVQSGSYGQYLGKITLTVNKYTKQVIDGSADELVTNNFGTRGDEEIDNIMVKYQTEIDKANEELGICGVTTYQSDGAQWAADTLRKNYNTQVSVVNSGGIRGLGFPLYANSMITYGDVFEIMPFENTVVTVSITGASLIKILNYSGLYFSGNVDADSKKVDGVVIKENEMYTISTIDYLYEKTNYPFLSGTNADLTGDIFRDVLAAEVKANVQANGKFYPSR